MWFKAGERNCFFCNNYLPMRDSKTAIINEIEHNFLMSGYISRNTYYNDYLNKLNNWCKHWSISTSEYDIELENRLRQEKDATRDYWH
jgi:hypothetical protein